MKGWLHQSALAQMCLAFRRQQPFTNQHLRAFERLTLPEHPLVGDQHIADVIRIGQQHDALPAQCHCRDVTERRRHVAQEFEALPRHAQDHVARESCFRAGRSGAGERWQRHLVVSETQVYC